LNLIEVTKNFATGVLATGLLVIHNTIRGGQDDETELTGWQQVGDPLLHIIDLDIKTRADDTTLVKTTVELDDDLTGAMIIDNLEFTNVAVLLHDSQEFDDYLGDGTDEYLTLSTLLSVVNALKSIVQHANTDHLPQKLVTACWYDSKEPIHHFDDDI